jgi:hypothetical protein
MDAVTGQAAAGLDAAGEFQLALVTEEQGITAEQATTLAGLWVSQFGRFFEGALSDQRGQRIRIDRLETCKRTILAESPYRPLAAAVPPTLRRVFGSYWIVSLCDASAEPVVSLAISILSEDLEIIGSRIVLPGGAHGQHFVPMGIPVSWDGPVAVSPEAAVINAARSSGRLVTEIPRFIAPDPRRGLPQEGRWQVILDKQVKVEAEGKVRSAGHLYFGRADLRAGQLQAEISISEDPVSFTVMFPQFDHTRGGPLEQRQLQPIPVAIESSPEYPVQFADASVIAEVE